jgi:succinate dehydrogenase / fumarate reductase cytochrome b subunit
MRLLSDSIGRKAVMAITGLIMVLFVVGHLLGNLTIFAGQDGINSYAEHLHALALIVWPTRAVLVLAVLLHATFAIQLALENRTARPTGYAVDRTLSATFAGRTMIYTGLIMATFVLFHLLHFTFRVTPGVVVGEDAQGRADVFTMVVSAFRNAPTALLYVAAMAALFLHLSHGAQSILQSLGLSNDKTRPPLGLSGRALSSILLVGFGAIPVLVFIGVVAR